MTVSPQLYNKAQEIKDTLYPKLRTVSMVDTLMPDDYNVPYQIMKALLEAVGETSPIPHRVIGMKDDVYPEHVSDLRTICYELWLYIYQKLLDPYTTDPEFFELKNILDSMRLPKHADELKPDEWNSISNYCRRMVDLILRYPAVPPVGLLESWDDWSHVYNNWKVGGWGTPPCILDTSTYVSPPSSFTSGSIEPSLAGAILINPDYINTPYVQIETYAKTKGDWGTLGGALGFSFRNTYFIPWSAWLPFVSLESIALDSCEYRVSCIDAVYMLFFDTFLNKCKAYWYPDVPKPILIGEKTLDVKPAHANEWNKYRASLSKHGEGINLKLEYWDGSRWRTMASFYHDSDYFEEDEHGVILEYHHTISSSARYIDWATRKYLDVRTWIDDTFVTKL